MLLWNVVSHVQEVYSGGQLWRGRQGKEAAVGRRKSRCPEVSVEASIDPPRSSEDELILENFPELFMTFSPHMESVIRCGCDHRWDSNLWKRLTTGDYLLVTCPAAGTISAPLLMGDFGVGWGEESQIIASPQVSLGDLVWICILFFNCERLASIPLCFDF